MVDDEDWEEDNGAWGGGVVTDRKSSVNKSYPAPSSQCWNQGSGCWSLYNGVLLLTTNILQTAKGTGHLSTW